VSTRRRRSGRLIQWCHGAVTALEHDEALAVCAKIKAKHPVRRRSGRLRSALGGSSLGDPLQRLKAPLQIAALDQAAQD
jgi:hypothetical protein